MGLLRNRGDDEGDGTRYQMREKLLSIGDDYWIEDDEGNRALHVDGDGKAVRLRQTFVVEDLNGDEVAHIQERMLSVRDKMEIERGDRSLATVKRALVGLRDRFSIQLANGAEMKAKGNIVDHEYEIERDGDTVATVSKRWFRVRDTYGVQIAPGHDAALILAITVCVDAMSDRGD